jgi:hypothetical protein
MLYSDFGSLDTRILKQITMRSVPIITQKKHKHSYLHPNRAQKRTNKHTKATDTKTS